MLGCHLLEACSFLLRDRQGVAMDGRGGGRTGRSGGSVIRIEYVRRKDLISMRTNYLSSRCSKILLINFYCCFYCWNSFQRVYPINLKNIINTLLWLNFDQNYYFNSTFIIIKMIGMSYVSSVRSPPNFLDSISNKKKKSLKPVLVPY